ncbi:MAG TPA: MoaD/ThiS family protein [Streptosporangiaceae bacterium]|jgi:sulfur-carrier protein|nr:MoaD/ThiS family protein [Streptosporangiaceae bacterium]
MAVVTMRYWAAAKEAAGVAEHELTADTLAAALAEGAARAEGGQLSAVLARSSFLIDGNPVGRRAADTVLLADGNVIEVLPPFAGG